MKLIAISGNAGAGKDTAADILVDDYEYVRISLADPIKRFGKRIFGFSDKQLWGPSEFRNTPDGRYVRYSQGKDIDSAWLDAHVRIEKYGEAWVQEVFGYENTLEVSRAYSDLLQWFDWLGSHHPKLSPRVMLQTLGTEWGRSQSKDLWVNYTLRTAAKVLSGKYWYSQPLGLGPVPSGGNIVPGVVVADLRFKNEMDAFKGVHAFLARIVREGTEDKALQLGIQGHQSEAEQQSISDDYFDMLINNNGSMDDLRETMRMVSILMKNR